MEEEVRLFDDRPRLFGTVLQFVLEGYNVPKEKADKWRSPLEVSCTIDLPDKRLGVLDGWCDLDPSFIRCLREVHGADDVCDEQKDARLCERTTGAHSAAEPKHRVDLTSGFRVHLSPEPLGHESFRFWV